MGSGNLSIRFSDKRDDKETIGVVRGGYGNKWGDILIKENLETTMTRLFTEVLEKTGYSVTPDAKVAFEGEIRQFLVDGNGWTQHAKEKIRVRLRDSGGGQILWEKTLSGEDGGMQGGIFSCEKSMNKALDRLLADAMEEISSEFFYQSVNKVK